MIDCPKLVLRLRTQQLVYEKADAFNLADEARQAADAIEELEWTLLLMVYQYCQGPDGSVHVWDSYGGGGYGTQAVPVPEHGDLIDRDALPWENQGLMLTDTDEWGLKAWDIEHAPPIIPADKEEP